MGFMKIGSPQPMEVVSDMCQICGKNKAQFNIKGKLVCSECKDSVPEEEKE